VLHLVAEGIESLLRSELGPGAGAVDVSFDAPDREWAAARNLPTVNCYLWNLGSNLDQRVTGAEIVEEDGKTYRRPPLPKLDLRYLVTAWADDPRDEQQLLGAAARVLIGKQVLPDAHVPEPLRARGAPQMRLLPLQPEDRADFWTALGGTYRAGLDLLVIATVDPGVRLELAPAPREVELRVVDTEEPARRSTRFWRRRSA
jgi:hypothetical protein